MKMFAIVYYFATLIYCDLFLLPATEHARTDLEAFLRDIEYTRWLSHQQLEASHLGALTTPGYELPRIVVSSICSHMVQIKY